MSAQLLEVTNLQVAFGDETILKGIDFAVAAGDCIGIVGRNGTGKTTLLRALSGFIPVRGGRMIWQGSDVTTSPAWMRARLGLVHVLEGGRVFQSMTVEENLSVGRLYRQGHDAPTMNDILLQFPLLTDPAIRKRPARTLSGGERVVVTIARAAAMSPKVLLLDSPFLGAGPHYRTSIAGLLEAWHRTKAVALVLVDHDLQTLSTLCTQLFTVENGLLKKKIV